MFTNFKKWLKLHLYPIFPRNKLLLRLCEIYDIFYYNQNYDSDINGEYHLISHLPNTFPKAPIVFDVGANIGEWSEYFLSTYSDAYIHTFEPSLNTYQVLSSNHQSKNFCHNNLAVGSAESVVKLNVYSDTGGINSIYPVSWEQDPIRVEEVKLTTLQHYCKINNITQIDYLKIDVEGHELAVLEGARDLLQGNSIQIVQFEFGKTRPDIRVYFKDIFKFLHNYQYTIYRIHPRNLECIKKYDESLEYKFANYIAVIPQLTEHF